MLELRDLARRYGDVVALDGVSFSVAPGQLFGFVGPNGAGKTTTMRIVLGVLAADRGEVLWRGEKVAAQTRSRFGYMPEERGLYPKMRVRDQLVYLARLHGASAPVAAAAAERWIERLGLQERAGDRVEALSLGNQQRVQLAAALVHDPELLVLDEPFSGLDPVGVDVLSGVLSEYAATGVPVVFSSHQLELVERLCEAVAIVKDGRLVASGTVEDLRSRGDHGRTVRVAVAGADDGWLARVPAAELVERAAKLVGLLQSADALSRAGAASDAAPLRVTTIEPVDDRRDRLGGLAFFTILLLYGQLITYGFWVASGVVEEKASRVVEVLLSTIRPRELLAGKVIGLGLLGLGQLMLVAAVGLVIASASGVLDVNGDILTAVGLTLVWFVLGYAFFACAFGCAGALVPRLEELQASTTPLTLLIMVSLFVAFAVNSDPDGTLAHVSAFIPFTAPMTLPPRILVGEAPWYEVVGGAIVTLAAAAALIPLAARIYSGAVLRTGSVVKLRDAWRGARA